MIFIAIIKYCYFTCLYTVLFNIKCDIPPYLKICFLSSHLIRFIHPNYVPFQRAEL